MSRLVERCVVRHTTNWWSWLLIGHTFCDVWCAEFMNEWLVPNLWVASFYFFSHLNRGSFGTYLLWYTIKSPSTCIVDLLIIFRYVFDEDRFLIRSRAKLVSYLDFLSIRIDVAPKCLWQQQEIVNISSLTAAKNTSGGTPMCWVSWELRAPPLQGPHPHCPKN